MLFGFGRKLTLSEVLSDPNKIKWYTNMRDRDMTTDAVYPLIKANKDALLSWFIKNKKFVLKDDFMFVSTTILAEMQLIVGDEENLYVTSFARRNKELLRRVLQITFSVLVQDLQEGKFEYM